MEKDFFAGVKIQDFKLSNGTHIGLPVRYYEWIAMMASFPAPIGKVRGMLPSKKLKPARLRPNTAVVSLMAMEYRRIADVEPYNEFAIMIPVLYDPKVNISGLPLLFPNRFSRFGFYVHHLPVTTQEAYIFGVEIWGYPKFVADISFEENDESRRCHLSAKGQDILTLDVKKLRMCRRYVDLYTYTVKNSELLRTPIQAHGNYGMVRFRGGASFKLGTHPIAEELRSLSMRETAVECRYATHLQSLLFPAQARFPIT
jgi:hypothetical protein